MLHSVNSNSILMKNEKFKTFSNNRLVVSRVATVVERKMCPTRKRIFLPRLTCCEKHPSLDVGGIFSFISITLMIGWKTLKENKTSVARYFPSAHLSFARASPQQFNWNNLEPTGELRAKWMFPSSSAPSITLGSNDSENLIFWPVPSPVRFLLKRPHIRWKAWYEKLKMDRLTKNLPDGELVSFYNKLLLVSSNYTFHLKKRNLIDLDNKHI